MRHLSRDWFWERKHLGDWKQTNKKICLISSQAPEKCSTHHCFGEGWQRIAGRSHFVGHLHHSHIEANLTACTFFLTNDVFAAILLMPLFGVGAGVSFICRAGIWTTVYLWVSVVGPSGFLVWKSKSNMGWSFWEASWVFTLALCDHGSLLCGKTLRFRAVCVAYP